MVAARGEERVGGFMTKLYSRRFKLIFLVYGPMESICLDDVTLVAHFDVTK